MNDDPMPGVLYVREGDTIVRYNVALVDAREIEPDVRTGATRWQFVALTMGRPTFPRTARRDTLPD